MNQSAIHKLSLAAPLPTGTINVYFSETPFPTLIDVPPNDPPLVDGLERALNGKGYSLKDMRRVIVTHPHFDHFGAARRIVDASGAEVWIGTGAGAYLTRFYEELSADFAYYHRFLGMAGFPEEKAEHLNYFYGVAQRLGCEVPVSRLLKDGDEVELAPGRFRVVSVPGHTPWCIMLHEPITGFALTGDFLLKEISSNAIIQRPSAAPGGYRSLKEYVSSLKMVEQMDLKRALPAHGDDIDDPGTRIKAVLASIARRKDRILAILRQGSPTTFQVTEEIFPDLQNEHVLLAMSEVMGYLELLEDEGTIRRTETPPFRFSTKG